MLKLTVVIFLIIYVYCQDTDPDKLGKFEITIVEYTKIITKPIVDVNDMEFSCLSKVPNNIIHDITNITRIPIYIRMGFFRYKRMEKMDCKELIDCLSKVKYADLMDNCMKQDNQRSLMRNVRYKISDNTVEETIEVEDRIKTFETGKCYSDNNIPIIIGNIMCKRGLITIKFLGIVSSFEIIQT